MQVKIKKLQAIPCNIITGFLGVGKTSAILHLLKYKPENERWAVLVNEFGEIGIDGSLIAGQKQQSGIFIKEVPGGCMCCTAGLPMQIALNQLLRQAKPDRLLIEPTGLGHPVEVIESLKSEYYKDVLKLEKTLTLVDARKLSDPRYTQHETFNQQISIADVIVANKLDQYHSSDIEALENYIPKHCQHSVELLFTKYGTIAPHYLSGPSQIQLKTKPASFINSQASQSKPNKEQAIPAEGYLSAVNQGEGFSSIGWRFTPYKVFCRAHLIHFFRGLKVERMKSVFITEDGIFAYNFADNYLTETEIDDCMESRVEIIASEINSNWEQQLMRCIVAAA